MPHTRYIFATRSDLESGLRAIEARRSLKYVQHTWSRTPHFEIYGSALDIPHLGIEEERVAIAARQFIVLPVDAEVKVRTIQQDDGGEHYEVDYKWHLEGIIFQPGGLVEGQYLLAGAIHTAGEAPESVPLYYSFMRSVTKGFTRVESWWLGSEALQLPKRGVRLVTWTIDEAPEYDLVP